MAIELVFPDNPNYTTFYTLDGREFMFNIRYNTRDDTWRLNISDPENNRLLTGVRCMPNSLLTGRYNRVDSGLFRGDILCIDTERVENIQTVNRSNFGTGKRYQLWYLAPREVQQLTGG